jgi:predicted ATPase/tetratricopeptide (TPR) repeat protein
MTPQTADRYTLVRPLGKGASGEVWEAVLHGPGGFEKAVALKRLKQGPDALPTDLLDEARLGAKLQHPNVVGVYSVDAFQGSWCVAMELVAGATVRELLASGPLPPSVVADLGAQLATALEHVHALRIDGRPLVHRDVKPANVLVDRYGVVKLADFGVATASSRNGAGTPGYAAPEQIAGLAEPRSDLFGLGMVLVVAALGSRPLDLPPATLASAPDAFEDLLRPALDARVPGLGPVAVRCLRADPALRFGSARAAAIELRMLAAQAPPGPSLQDVVVARRPELAPAVPAGTDETVLEARHNLGPPTDALVGRAAELQDLQDRLGAGARLVTLLGPGGTGKTRLATELARKLAPRLVGGAWFADLTEARSADAVRFAVARALELELAGGDPAARLTRALDARGRLLLVLDNAEQVVADVAAEVTSWLRAAPRLTVVCTSRVALELGAEDLVFLGPLSDDDGAALFLRRSRRDDPAAAVVPLVRLLEGSALALELAAARAGALPLDVLCEQLAGGSLALRSSRRDLPDRQRSVEASLRWSWDLASPCARAALAQLSVTEGGFDARAAAAILDLSPFPEAGSPLDVLHELVHSSLLRAEPSGRFRLLVSVKDFAARALADDDRQRVGLRHARWYAQLSGHPARVVELQNLVAGTHLALDAGQPELAAGTAAGAWAVFGRFGPVEVGVALLGEVIDALPAGSRAWQHLVALRAPEVVTTVGEFVQWGLDAIGRGEQPPHHRLLWVVGAFQSNVDPVAASVTLARAKAAAEAAGDLGTVVATLVSESRCARLRGDVREAERAIREGVTQAERLGDPFELADGLSALGSFLAFVGRWAEAGASLERSLAVRHAQTDYFALARLAQVRARLGDGPGAQEALFRAERSTNVTEPDTNMTLTVARAELAAAAGDRRAPELYRHAIWALEARGTTVLTAELHLALARSLVAVGAGEDALRHVAVANRVLGEYPNARLQALADVLLLPGDVPALERAAERLAAPDGPREDHHLALHTLALALAPTEPDRAVALLRRLVREDHPPTRGLAAAALTHLVPWDDVAAGVDAELAALRGTMWRPTLATLLVAKVLALAPRDLPAARSAWHELAALLPLELPTPVRADLDRARATVR